MCAVQSHCFHNKQPTGREAQLAARQCKQDDQ